jgi:hypothetical protein
MIQKSVGKDKILFSGRCHLTIAVAAIWYLLTPPMAGSSGVNTTAPLSNWANEGTYNTQNDCQAAKNNYTTMVSKPSSTGSQTLNILAIEQSQCVASDDFRLEGGQSGAAQGSGQQQPLGQQQPSFSSH